MFKPLIRLLLAAMMLIAPTMWVTGCSTTGGDKAKPVVEAAAALTVKYAVMRFIEADPVDPGGRARGVMRFADIAIAVIEKDASVTIPQLADTVRSRIPWKELSVADRMLADALIMTVQNHLQERIDSEVMPPDKLVRVRTVIKLVIDIARMYGAI